jgi:antitoxin CptB
MEADDIALRRLRWRARRGMRELDLVLRSFVERQLPALDAAGRDAFSALLEVDDVTLLDWCTGRSVPADPRFAQLVAALRAGAGR